MKPYLWPMIIVLLCFPCAARADVGTPLMWATMFHLMIGNAVIGLVEGLLIAWVFRLRKKLCIPGMITANYVSAYVGGIPIVAAANAYLPLSINNAQQRVLALLAITYLATLLLEWPFVIFLFEKSPYRLSRSFRANLMAQTVSYLGLVGWYALASSTALYTDIRVVPASQMQAPAGAVVYYIAATDGDVYRQQLPAGPAEKVYALKSTSRDDTLFVRRSTVDPDRWDLFARRDRTDSKPGKDVIIKESFAATAVPWWEDGEEDPWFPDHWARGLVRRLGDAVDSRWKFEVYFSTGLLGTPRSPGKPIQLRVETLFAQWNPCNATQLPDDQVVFQLGQDQICMLDPQSRRMSLIAQGQGPVVAVNDRPAASRPDDEKDGELARQ